MKIKIKQKTSEWFDAVRGFSAIIVLIAHLNQVFNIPIFGLNGFCHLFFGILARYAVICFFILSGFLITMSILKNITINNRFDSLDFLKKRLIRIYPPYFFSLLLCVFIYYVVSYFEMHGYNTFRTPDDLYLAREKFSLVPQTYYKAFFILHNIIEGYPSSINMNGPLWSISYEWWLYILAMFFSIWVKNKNYLIGLVSFLIIMVYLFHTSNYSFIWFSTFWVLGAISAIIYSKKLKIKKNIIIPIIISLLTIVIVYLFNDWKILIPRDDNITFSFQLLISVLLVLVFSFPLFRYNLFINIFKKTAKFSYTLYVIHFPIILISYSILHVFYQNQNNFTRLLVFLSLCIIIIIISNFLSTFLENKNIHIAMIKKISNKFKTNINSTAPKNKSK